jgi:hypothetical protein
MMVRITRTLLRKWGMCWDDEKIALYVPPEGLDSTVVFNWAIPAPEKIWILLRPEVLGEKLLGVIDPITDYVVEKYCVSCGNTIIEEWAKKWLSGEDRSETSAQAVRMIAWDNLGHNATPTWAMRTAINAAQKDAIRAAATARGTDKGSDIEGERQVEIIRQALMRD